MFDIKIYYYLHEKYKSLENCLSHVANIVNAKNCQMFIKIVENNEKLQKYCWIVQIILKICLKYEENCWTLMKISYKSSKFL